MNLQSTCIYNFYRGYLRLLYNRNADKIMLIPCCTLMPKRLIEPIAFDSDYFINNFDECIEKYQKFNLLDLNKYYYGDCLKLVMKNLPFKELCQSYTSNI